VSVWKEWGCDGSGTSHPPPYISLAVVVLVVVSSLVNNVKCSTGYLFSHTPHHQTNSLKYGQVG